VRPDARALRLGRLLAEMELIVSGHFDRQQMLARIAEARTLA
jgi:hypothetical protein